MQFHDMTKLMIIIRNGIIIPLLLGLVFIFSGITKMIWIQSFENEIGMYSKFYFNDFLLDYKHIFALGLNIIEITVGILVLFSKTRLFANIVILFLLTIFLIITGVNYFAPPLLGQFESCGCFGEFIHFTPLASFIKTLILWSLSLVSLVLTRNSLH